MAKKTTKTAKSDVPPDMEVLPKVEREIKIELTPLESKERLDRIIEIQMSVDSKTQDLEDLKQQSDDLKESIKKLEAEKDQLSKGGVLKMVEPVKNYEKKQVEFYYPNFAHGKMVGEPVPFTADDHQKRMFQEEAESIPATGSNPLASEMTQ